MPRPNRYAAWRWLYSSFHRRRTRINRYLARRLKVCSLDWHKALQIWRLNRDWAGILLRLSPLWTQSRTYCPSRTSASQHWECEAVVYVPSWPHADGAEVSGSHRFPGASDPVRESLRCHLQRDRAKISISECLDPSSQEVPSQRFQGYIHHPPSHPPSCLSTTRGDG